MTALLLLFIDLCRLCNTPQNLPFLHHALGIMMWAASGVALFYRYLSIRAMSALYIAGA